MSAHDKPFGILACDVLELEVKRMVHHMRLQPLEMNFLPMGMHDHSDSLRRELQQQVDTFEEAGCQRILFVYGLCSNSILGLTARQAEMVFPRAHDCITLFLGSKERYAALQRKHPGVYWFSPGWIRGKRVPGPHHFESLHQQYLERFDEEEADYLLEMEREKFSHYTHLGYTDLGDGPVRESREEARVSAQYLGLEFLECEGDDGLLRRLLAGPWDEAEFLTVPAGHTAAFEADQTILKCQRCGQCGAQA
jgi:hypothetical protein